MGATKENSFTSVDGIYPLPHHASLIDIQSLTQEKSRPVSIRSGVGHAQDTGACVLEIEVLVGEFSSVAEDGPSSRAWGRERSGTSRGMSIRMLSVCLLDTAQQLCAVSSTQQSS